MKIDTILGSGPNTFMEFWSDEELKAWFKEHSYRALHYPEIYIFSFSWRKRIKEEIKNRKSDDRNRIKINK